MTTHLPPEERHERDRDEYILPTALPLPMRAIAEVDGSCPLNPGPMGIGYILSVESKVVARVGAQIGPGTNNQAEYHALISAMRHALYLGLYDLLVFSDSLLMVNQIRGTYKVKGEELRNLHREAKYLTTLFARFQIEHRPRERNVDADSLSRQVVYESPRIDRRQATKAQVKLALAEWQAAAVKVWLQRPEVELGSIARIFNVDKKLLEKIKYGQRYKRSSFSTYLTHLNNILGTPGESLGISELTSRLRT